MNDVVRDIDRQTPSIAVAASSTAPSASGSAGLCRTPAYVAKWARGELLAGSEAWNGFLRDYLSWMKLSAHCGLMVARVQALRAAGATLLDIGTGPESGLQLNSRGSAGSDCLQFVWSHTGRFEIEQDGRVCPVSAGRLAVCDPARVQRIRFAPSERIGIFIAPNALLASRHPDGSRMPATVLEDSSSIRAALAALTTLIASSDQDAAQISVILRAAEWMLMASLHRASETDAGDRVGDARMRRIKRYIVDNIGNSALNAAAVAAAMGMSRRSLYSHFNDRGLTPTQWIKEERLVLVMQAISDPGKRHRRLTDLALDFGYADYATFSRLFKLRFGRPPSAVRPASSAPYVLGQPDIEKRELVRDDEDAARGGPAGLRSHDLIRRHGVRMQSHRNPQDSRRHSAAQGD